MASSPLDLATRGMPADFWISRSMQRGSTPIGSEGEPLPYAATYLQLSGKFSERETGSESANSQQRPPISYDYTGKRVNAGDIVCLESKSEGWLRRESGIWTRVLMDVDSSCILQMRISVYVR